MTLKETLITSPQYILPQHALSKAMSYLTHCENKLWKNIFIRQIIQHYNVNMSESLEENIENFNSFNHFFTRELKPHVRPLTQVENAIACPADGVISQVGTITNGEIFQAKGKNFTTVDLLGGHVERAKPFEQGEFATIYLSPKDYHRLHMPLAGKLVEMIHVPGKLFSVNGATTNSVVGLFARNERVVAIFETEFGKMALILVGAIFVSSIETIWHGVVTPPTVKEPRIWTYQDNAPILQKGQEMGRFNMGSTIIILFEQNRMNWLSELHENSPVKLGECVGIGKK